MQVLNIMTVLISLSLKKNL
ncbi:rCG52688 [Rattus norvegicus]|uniref:RCG52688 n=1 Tax=Rattus norvegicus TaxID=10116 RepID=A6IQK2_RAT|nr:rCG52688 [Rattus norvegicus]